MDFLESWFFNVQFPGKFAEMHSCRKWKEIGPAKAVANADDYPQVRPGAENAVAMNILNIMAEKYWIRSRGFDYSIQSSSGALPWDPTAWHTAIFIS